MTQLLDRSTNQPLLVHLSPVIEMTEDQFFRFCQINRDLRIERNADGDLLIMPPTGGRTGNRNFRLIGQFSTWVENDQSGIGFDSSTGFVLPNGAKRSPDVSWIHKSRLASLTDEQKEKFIPLCPDFVVEILSPSDRLEDVQAKMEEYIGSGAKLGWLIDSPERAIHVYRENGSVEVLRDSTSISGEPMLPGFVLNLQEIWNLDL